MEDVARAGSISALQADASTTGVKTNTATNKVSSAVMIQCLLEVTPMSLPITTGRSIKARVVADVNGAPDVRHHVCI